MKTDPKENITGLLRARNSLIWIQSPEELRVERAILEAAGFAKYQVEYWDCATGLTDAQGEAIDNQLCDPAGIVKYIYDSTDRKVYVLRDIHAWLDPQIIRLLKTASRELSSAPITEARAIILLTPPTEVPKELRTSATVIEWPLPDRNEMASVLDTVIDSIPEELSNAVKAQNHREASIDAAMGLTAMEAASCYAQSLVTTKTIDPAIVSAEKKRVIAREKVLTWTDPDPRGMDAIGGLDALKDWLTERKAALSKEARDFGLPAPKGVLLTGVPGCGKSLTAKCIAATWQIPLLRLDLGALKSKWVGESEANIRKALEVAETVAPCVLWLDEIEKALGGSTQGAADGGVSSDALGAILLWMQERTATVFVVATTNDVTALPPEFTRKGRFDELFFVDLPTHDERKEILKATLAQFDRDAKGIAVGMIADATDGFSGAEVAALVPEALFVTFKDKKRKIKTKDLIDAAKATVPMSKTSGDKIEKLRKWAVGRARYANPTQKTKTSKTTLDLE